jgi:hypothetical protein
VFESPRARHFPEILLPLYCPNLQAVARSNRLSDARTSEARTDVLFALDDHLDARDTVNYAANDAILVHFLVPNR